MLESSLAEVVVRATLFMAIGLLVGRMVERRSATLSHRVLAVTGLCVVLIPIINLFGPRWEWRYPDWLASNNSFSSLGFHDESLTVGRTDVVASAVRSIPAIPKHTDSTWSWFSIGISVWIFGSCLRMARIIRALHRLRVELARFSSPSIAIRDEVHSMADALRVNDRVQVKISPRGAMPMVCWFGRWFLVLPSNIESWAVEVRDATLSHELGHISRRDVWVDYAVQALSCLLWWHPLMWMMERAVTRVRELACDEWVLQNCQLSPINYSHALLDVVRRCQTEELVLATPMATKEELEGRLRSIASPNRTRRIRRFWLFFCAWGMAIVCLGLAAFTLVNKSSVGNAGFFEGQWVDGNPTMKSGGSTLTGSVTYEGNPVAGVKLKVFKHVQGSPLKLHASLTTDDQGRYKITDMHPGDQYQFEVFPKGNLMVRNWQYQSPYVVTLGGIEGETIELPDAVLISNTQTLKGLVVDPAGKPVPGISVSANLASGQMLSRPVAGQVPWTQTDQQGRFTLSDLPDEPIELMAYKPNPAGGRIVHPSKLKVAINANDIRMILDPTLGSGIEDLDAK